MNIKKIVGYGMLVLFGLALFGLVVWQTGILQALIAFGIMFFLSIFIIVAVELITSDE